MTEPIAYLNGWRIKQACCLIEKGTAITEAALDVGFGDLSYFSRTFKREMGVSPHTFRRNKVWAGLAK